MGQDMMQQAGVAKMIGSSLTQQKEEKKTALPDYVYESCAKYGVV